MKKLLTLMLLLVTVVILVVPTPALAKNKWQPPQWFSATAQVYVSDKGDPVPTYLSPTLILLNTTGEEVTGTVSSSQGWDIEGLVFVFQHTSRTFINLNTMKITGTASGTITVYKGAKQVMAGNYSAFIRGDIDILPTMDVIYTKIYDSATFSLEGTAKEYKKNTAYGFAFADLDWDYNLGTLVGTMKLTGSYR